MIVSFYSDLHFSSSDYVYFNLSDTSNNFDGKMYYCLTQNDPRVYYLRIIRFCQFNPLVFYRKEKNYGNSEYYFKVNIEYSSGNYIILRYKYDSINGDLYAQSSYYEFKKEMPSSYGYPLCTIEIVFIAIGGVAFVGIIITLICFCCQKRSVNNINNSHDESSMVTSALEEKNNVSWIIYNLVDIL